MYRLKDMLAKITIKDEVKNDYYFYEHRYYSDSKKDFELEIVFNEDSEKCVIDVGHIDMVEADKKYPILSKAKEVSIYDCLDTFNKWETLDINNLWYCPSCKDNVQAKKKMEIIRAPPILVLHLKRFKARASGVASTTGGRLNTLVDFPLTGLDLSKYVKGADPEPIYDLYAVSNHYGSTGFGHYTAFAWNKSDKDWHRFDDSHVTKMEPVEVCSSAAYVLFYRRKDIGDEVDYKAIEQVVPEWYKVPVIVPIPKQSNGKAIAEEKEKMNSNAAATVPATQIVINGNHEVSREPVEMILQEDNDTAAMHRRNNTNRERNEQDGNDSDL